MFFFSLSRSCFTACKDGVGEISNSQLQQGQIGIAVKRPILALLHHIVLKHGGSLWVISIQTIQDRVDVRWSCIAFVG